MGKNKNKNKNKNNNKNNKVQKKQQKRQSPPSSEDESEEEWDANEFERNNPELMKMVGVVGVDDDVEEGDEASDSGESDSSMDSEQARQELEELRQMGFDIEDLESRERINQDEDDEDDDDDDDDEEVEGDEENSNVFREGQAGIWGMELKPNEPEAVMLAPGSVRQITQAALATFDEGRTTMYVVMNDTKYVLCSLTPGLNENATLNYELKNTMGGMPFADALEEEFEEEDLEDLMPMTAIVLFSEGPNTIHLTGNQNDFEMEGDEGENPYDLDDFEDGDFEPSEDSIEFDDETMQNTMNNSAYGFGESDSDEEESDEEESDDESEEEEPVVGQKRKSFGKGGSKNNTPNKKQAKQSTPKSSGKKKNRK